MLGEFGPVGLVVVKKVGLTDDDDDDNHIAGCVREQVHL